MTAADGDAPRRAPRRPGHRSPRALRSRQLNHRPAGRPFLIARRQHEPSRCRRRWPACVPPPSRGLPDAGGAPPPPARIGS